MTTTSNGRSTGAAMTPSSGKPDAELTPAELEARIEATREELAATVGAIGEKVDALKESVKPSNVVRRPKVAQGLGIAGGALAVVVLVKLVRRLRRDR